MHTQKIDFSAFDIVAIEIHVDRNARNEAIKFVLFASPDADEPLIWLARRQQSPAHAVESGACS